jgi:hypothetical protein
MAQKPLEQEGAEINRLTMACSRILHDVDLAMAGTVIADLIAALLVQYVDADREAVLKRMLETTSRLIPVYDQAKRHRRHLN